MRQTGEIKDVSDTSFWVAHYRAVESDRPDALFHDRFAKELVGEHGIKISESMHQTSRYTQWSVVSRTVIIDRFVEKLVREEGVDAVINLGAGLDTRPYRMRLPENLLWVEADYPHILIHKNSVLQNEKPSCRLLRIEVDLANAQKRQEFFESVAADSKKVLILTEGVLPYLNPDQVTELSNDLQKQHRFHFWIAEYFHPGVYRYLKNAVRDMKMKNAPFQFFPPDWIAFFNNLGWKKKELRYSSEIAIEFKRRPPMPKWAEIIFPFLPKKIKDQAQQMAGYMIFER